MYRMDRVTTTRRRYRLTGCAGVLLFALALVGISAYGVTILRKYDPQIFANLPANPFARKLTMSGMVYATDPARQEAGQSVTAAVAATVDCNGARTSAHADGSYRLTLVATDTYLCTVSAGAAYATLKVVVPGSSTHDFRVNFGPDLPEACSAAKGSSVIECPVLRPPPGTLSGTVTSEDTHRPLDGVRVMCWNPGGGKTGDVNPYASASATTDTQGDYAIAGLAVDRYLCNASGDWRLHASGVAPHATTKLDLVRCQAHCPAVSYHNGAVMHTFTAYLIYWLPKGAVYDAVGNASYERVTTNYFKDVGGSPFYNIVTQYWDAPNGPMLNSVTLGGAYVDSQPYPTAATATDPLSDSDVQQEIGRVMAANHWTATPDHAFFVFTGYGAEVCGDDTKSSCSYSSTTGFCGYHSATREATPVIYAVVVDNQRCAGPINDYPTIGPNGDRIADGAASVASHEQFEAATDPLGQSWYDDLLVKGTVNRGEVADKCEEHADYVQLDHGHTYYIQAEWSDAINSCAFKL